MRLFLLLTACTTLHAQWLNYPSRGTPRSKDGKPDLQARTPRASGKPVLSGVWQVAPAAGEVEKLFGKLDVEDVPGDDLTTFSKYFFNILADFARGHEPMTPEAFAAMKNGPQHALSPDERCLPLSVPRGDLIGFPFKIVQTAEQLVAMYEADHTHRQIYLDGRPLPKDPNPAWLGYSVGRWEGDTLVVDTTGFNAEVQLDTMRHPHSDKLRVQERFHRDDFGHMGLQITIDDPRMYTKAIAFSVRLLLMPDSDILESFCNENEKDRAHLK